MLPSPMVFRRALASFAVVGVFAALAAAQQGRVPARITAPIDTTNLRILKGNVHPLARAEFDRGPAPASLPLKRMLLVLKPSPDQERGLDALLDQQQDKTSPNYHAWLTPQQFGQQFGPADQDIQKIVSWLESQGFQVDGVANGRGVIEFSGNAGQVQNAFRAEIHRYAVNGTDHWANATDPQIPAALAAVVAGVASLNDFRKRPMHQLAGLFARSKETGQIKPASPNFTSTCGVNPNTGQPESCYGLGPYDFATIYNVLPLWNATPPIDGTGQSIAIVARTNINLQDVSDFQALFGLPANPPRVILDGPDPGLVPGDETESDLDVEWSGAVAKGATIKFVVSQSTETSDGIDLSALYIVDNDLAPIMSESYGECELGLGTAGNQFANNLWRQAAAEGITVFVSSGDSGSAGCDFYSGGSAPEPAQYGLEVNGLASTPYDVAVGGTDFNDFFNPTTYWNSTSNSTTQESVKGYIPETAWNDSCTNAIFGQIGYSTNAETNCNNSQLSSLVSTRGAGGGKSACTSPSSPTPSACAGGYAKPSWQTGTGVPGDGKRDLPDVSLFASNGFVGNFYMMCERDASNGPCSTSNFLGIGGTSAAAPAFAGLLALVDQKLGARQGNANYIFYKLAAKQGATGCNSSSDPAGTCVFNDITSGTIAMPCLQGTANCSPSSGHTYGVLPGYATTTGYDLATGLGTANANNLVNDWSSVSSTPSTTTLTLNGGNPVSITHGSSIPVSVSVAPNSPQPTGNVALLAMQSGNPTSLGTLTLSSGSASASVNTLPGGASYSVEARYAGDANYSGSDSNAVTVTVSPESSKIKLGIITFLGSGQVSSTNATSFPYGSPYILRSDVTNSAGTNCFSAATKSPAYPCPTGSLTLTDNGAPLGGGAFGLNGEGYTEFQTIQLAGGLHNLVASYGGDSSYNASSSTDAVTVTPAPTTTTITAPVPSTPAPTAIIGAPFFVSVRTDSNSSGVAPSANQQSYLVFDGSTQLSDSVGFATSSNGSSTGDAWVGTVLQTAISAPSGPHTLSVRYDGDSNYGSSTSTGVTINAVYPTALAVSASPSSVVYGQNTTVTITAALSTTNPASNTALKPTGSVSFSNLSQGGQVIGTATTTLGQDTNGNWMLTGTITVAPQQTEAIEATYSGDANYSSNTSSAVLISVTVPDFTITSNPSPMVVTAGQTAATTITLTPTTNYITTVALNCSGLAFYGETCSISPQSLTLSDGAPAAATLSVTTLPPPSALTAMTAPARTPFSPLIPRGRGTWWTISAVAGLIAFVLWLPPTRRRSKWAIQGLAVVCLVGFLVGCGGGTSGSTPGGGGGPTYAVTTTALNVSTGKVPQGSSVTLTATVSSTKPLGGSVGFSSPNCGLWRGAGGPLTNGSAQAQVNSVNLQALGTCFLVAGYSGDSVNTSSQSGQIGVVFLGTASQMVTGQLSTNSHYTQVKITLQ
jgi:Pro-kumamolisin, activation domain/Bacterial Ig-like domain (group 3)